MTEDAVTTGAVVQVPRVDPFSRASASLTHRLALPSLEPFGLMRARRVGEDIRRARGETTPGDALYIQPDKPLVPPPPVHIHVTQDVGADRPLRLSGALMEDRGAGVK